MQTGSHQQFILDGFEGSLELLLYLCKRSEISIEQLSLTDMTAQLNELLFDDEEAIDHSADLLSPAASLLLLKSRLLLPVDEEALCSQDGEQTAPIEVMQHVLDYCRFRQVAAELVDKERKQSGRHQRLAGNDLPPSPRGAGVSHLALTDLLQLVEQTLKRATKNPPQVIEEEKWRIADAIDLMRQELASGEPVAWTHYFNEERQRGEMIVFFLAILELMKLQELRVIEGAVIAA